MRKASTLALAVLLMSCDKSSQTQTDSASGAAATQQLSASAARSPDLAKAIDDYTGDEFFSHVRGLQYVGGTERERTCRGCTGADAAQRTRVRVDGVEGADSVTAGTVPRFGIVVARAENRGGRQEDRYGMRPGNRFEYYLIVMPGSGGGPARWRVEELEIVGNRYTHRQLAVGQVIECDHPFQRGARSDFRTCDSADAVNPVALGAFIQGGGSGDDPWWYGCGTGCWVAERGGDA